MYLENENIQLEERVKAALNHFLFVHNYTIEQGAPDGSQGVYWYFTTSSTTFQLPWGIDPNSNTTLCTKCALPKAIANEVLNLIKRSEAAQEEQAFTLEQHYPDKYYILVDVDKLDDTQLIQNKIKHRKKLELVAKFMTEIHSPIQGEKWIVSDLKTQYENYNGIITHIREYEREDPDDFSRFFSDSDILDNLEKDKEKYALLSNGSDSQKKYIEKPTTIYFCSLASSGVHKICFLPKNTFFIDRLIPAAETYFAKQQLLLKEIIFKLAFDPSNSSSIFSTLTVELLYHIASFLDESSSKQLKMTCKKSNEAEKIFSFFKEEKRKERKKEDEENSKCIIC